MIEVIRSGSHSTIQDLGRVGYQKIGVPPSGAMDSFSFKCANLLVGNNPNDAGLEITLYGPELLFEDDLAIAITGADLGPKINGDKVDNWKTIRVKSGDILSFVGPSHGVRSYIAFSGGIDEGTAPRILGSRSTYIPSGLGGINGRALCAGDKLGIGEPLRSDIVYRSLSSPPNFAEPVVLRVVCGPHDDMFSKNALDTLTGSEYTVALDSDRMGCRLDGPPLDHLDGADIISDGNAFGAIQVPGDGLPIILLADRGTTGGYTKIATVISADGILLGQLMPGSVVQFRTVTLDEALAARIAQEGLLMELMGEVDSRMHVVSDGSMLEVVRDDGEPLKYTHPTRKSYSLKVHHNSQEIDVEVQIGRHGDFESERM